MSESYKIDEGGCHAPTRRWLPRSDTIAATDQTDWELRVEAQLPGLAAAAAPIVTFQIEAANAYGMRSCGAIVSGGGGTWRCDTSAIPRGRGDRSSATSGM